MFDESFESNLFAMFFLVVGGIVAAVLAARFRRLSVVAASLCVSAGAVLGGIGTDTGYWLPPFLLGSACLLLALTHQLHRPWALRLRAVLMRPAIHAVFLLAGSLTAGFLWVARHELITETQDISAVVGVYPDREALRKTAPVTATTDRGTPIELFTLELAKDDPDLKKRDDQLQAAFAMRAITLDARDPGTNCHGWVFAGGRYCVHGNDVATILDENSYIAVKDPEVDDVVVYYDPEGRVVHTGIVRVISDRFHLVESKWGAMGRFLHTLADQPYSSTYRFYRSPRDSHLLAIKGQPSPSTSGTIDTSE